MPGTTREHPPLVVIANSQEWYTRSLESILGPRGYAVLRAYNGRQALEHCHSSHPDIIMVDADLPDMDGLEVVAALRDDPAISPSTPILVTSVGKASRQERLKALKAGAWEFLDSALDDEELPLKLDTYVKAKFDADRAREESLLDELTGLYSVRGLARRARELGAQAFRKREPFACVVFSPVLNGTADKPGAEERGRELAERLARAIRERSRVSDATGRLGPNEFAIIAQGANADDVVRLAERLTSELRAELPGSGVRIAAGYDVVPNYHDAPIDPPEMLAHASQAMHMSRTKAQGPWIRQFDPKAAN